MTGLTGRTTAATQLEDSVREPSGTPRDRLPPEAPVPPAPWPSKAKLVIAVLAIAALLGAAGTIVGFTSDNGPSATERELESTIAALTSERDDLAAEVPELESTVDSIAAERESLVSRVTELDKTISELAAERDDLAAQQEAMSAAATADRDELVAQIAELDATIEALTTSRDELALRVADYETTIATLRADVATATDRATTAEAERDVLADLFPITFDVSLDDVPVDDLAGTYEASFDEAFCSGYAACGSELGVEEVRITKHPPGNLRVDIITAADIDQLVYAGLHRVGGALYGVAETSHRLTDCGTTPRLACVAVTIFAHGSAAADGTQQIPDLGATLTILAEADGGCPASLAFYGSDLTPQS